MATEKTPDEAFEEAMNNAGESVRREEAQERAAKRLAVSSIEIIQGKKPEIVFFSVIIMNLLKVPRWDIQTMETDGTHIFYNPDFVNSLKLVGNKIPELNGILCHLAMHIALSHHTRRGMRKEEDWNVAADLAINNIIKQAGIPLPETAIYPKVGEYKDFPENLGAEEYYNLLFKEEKDQESQGGDKEGKGGGKSFGGVTEPKKDNKDGKGSELTQTEMEQAKENSRILIAQAEQQARLAGTLSAGLSRIVSELLHPEQNWKDILREYVNKISKNDYNWGVPNRRYLTQGLYLPGMKSLELGDVVVCVDTSGSIGGPILDRFASEIEGILEAYDCTVHILYHDTHVCGKQVWNSSDGPLKLEPKGGGGTSHVDVLEKAAEMEPVITVCLTDMYSQFPESFTAGPLIWASIVDNKNLAPKYGEFIYVKE